MHLISIIVPVYQVKEYIERCVESILSQSFRYYELILVDDGSTDGSGEVCDELALKDSRIKVIHQNNSGVSAARNIGIDNASGDYIIFIDADDYVSPLLCEHLLDSFQNNDDIDLVIAGYVNEYVKRQRKVVLEVSEVYGIDDFKKCFDVFYKKGLLNSACAKLYKSRLLKNIRFDNNVSMGEDLLFNLQYYSQCNNIAFLNEADYFYNLTNMQSATKKYNEKYFDCYKKYYSEAKLFKYGEVKFNNDAIDEIFCLNILMYIQGLCNQNVEKILKVDKIKTIFEEASVRNVFKGKYKFGIKLTILKKLCLYKMFKSIVWLFGLKKFVAKLVGE